MSSARTALFPPLAALLSAAGVTGCGGGADTGGGGNSSANTSSSDHGAGAGPSSGPGAGGSSSSSSGPGGGTSGDTYGKWEGGSAYYAPWSNGPPSSASFFPISVWLQDPGDAPAYEAIGVNQFIGLWQGPTPDQLTGLASANMAALCDQNADGLADAAGAKIRGWTQPDEPDNAQSDGMGGYVACIDPQTIQASYTQWTGADPTRPVFLNFGQGSAYTDYIGRGSCTGHTGDYAKYMLGADILSFDIYPMNETDPPVAKDLSYVAKGVDNLRGWADYKKPVWNWIECTAINDPSGKPTPDEVRSEVWLAIVHGSLGIGYFVHSFVAPEDDHALLDDDTMKAAVGAINHRIAYLAPALNTKPVDNGVTVTSSDAASPIDVLLKRHAGKTYLLTVLNAATAVHGKFDLARFPSSATATVLDEGRTISIGGGHFEDDYDAWGVHLYEIDAE